MPGTLSVLPIQPCHVKGGKCLSAPNQTGAVSGCALAVVPKCALHSTNQDLTPRLCRAEDAKLSTKYAQEFLWRGALGERRGECFFS